MQNQLTNGTAQRIAWEKISSTEAERLAITRGPNAELDERYAEHVGAVFAAAKMEFACALGPLRRQVQVALWIILPMLALAVGAGCLVAVWRNAVAGTAISTTALVAFFGVLNRAWHLGKDQAILELTPASYEVLFRVCRTKSDHETVFKAFMVEVAAMRSGLRR